MFEINAAAVGIVLVLTGIAFTLLAFGITRWLPRRQSTASVPPTHASGKVAHHQEAVLLVQNGGRVVYLNRPAREMFDAREEAPNLESLARRARPSETFLMLCAAEGRGRFTLNGQFVEGTSYYMPGALAAEAKKKPTPSATILVSLRRTSLIIDANHRKAAELPGDNASSRESNLAELPDGVGGSEAEGDGAGVNASDAMPADSPGQAFSFFYELTQNMAASLDLEATLTAVMECVEQLLPCEFIEITIWDVEAGYLAPYRLVGLPGGDHRLEKSVKPYQVNQGYSGYLATHHEALLVKDVSAYQLAQPELDRQRYPFQSYLGVPLLVAGEFIGTLEVASLVKATYTENHLGVLQLLAGQASVAINNALLYRSESQRSVAMAGLANLAKSASLVRDPQELFTHLVQNTSRLLDVEMLGFLIYNENRRVLEGQAPFIGLPSSILEWCQAPIPADSPAEEIWRTGETIVATDAPNDKRIQAFELHHLALAAGIHQTVLMPLSVGGQMLGYLQVANKRDGTPFDANDLRFLAIIAGQAAPMIENLTLVRQSRRRALRAETLRRIASLTSSAATLEEILKFSLMDLARLLQVDTAAIFLVDENLGEMRVHRGSLFGIPPEISNRLGRIPTDGPQFLQTVAGSRQVVISSDSSQAYEPAEQQTSELRIGEYYSPIIEGLQIRSVVIVPIILREEGIGELFAGSFQPNFFNAGDAQTISTASGQFASAIERAALYSQTDSTLRQRVDQLVALTQVSRELNTTIKLEDLLRRVYTEALHATRADCGSIILFDLDKDILGSSLEPLPDKDDPGILFQYGDECAERLHPLERKVLARAEAFIIDDFNPPIQVIQTEDMNASENSHQDNIYIEFSPAHPGVRSALVVPIAYQGQVAGLIHLHAKTPNNFEPAELEVVEALAIQAAIAIGNARRFREQQKRGEELNQRVETLSKILEVAQVLQGEQPLEQSLEVIAHAIQVATPFDRVLISIYDSEHNHLQRMACAGIPSNEMEILRAHPAPWNSIKSLLSPRSNLGCSYFIPAEDADTVPDDLVTYPLQADEMEPGDGSHPESVRWHPDDLWIMPLFQTSGEPLGLISVDAPRNGLRPERPTIEAVDIFGIQAALIIEIQLKLNHLRRHASQAQTDLVLAQKTAQEVQLQLVGLQKKDQQHYLAIKDLEQRARRINAGLDIAEIINHKSSREEVFLALGQEILSRMDFDTVLIAENRDNGISLAHSLGNITNEANLKALLGQRNPLRQCFQDGEIIMVSDLGRNEAWKNSTFLRSLETSSFLCLPIIKAVYNGDGYNGTGAASGQQNRTSQDVRRNGKEKGEKYFSTAMLAIGHHPVASFTDQDEQMFRLLTRQVAIALQNLSLLEESKRRLTEVNLLLEFSRQLDRLDPDSILNALIESALHIAPAAQMAMVAIWDARQDSLVPRASWGYANPQELMSVRYRPGEGLPGQVFEQKRAVNLDELDFAHHYNLSAENLLRFRNATGGKLPVSSLAVPILAGSIRPGSTLAQGSDSQIDRARVRSLGVLILDSTETTSAFTENDLTLISSLAQQTTLTIENARLYQESVQRAIDLDHRTETLSILNRLSNELSGSLDVAQILDYAVKEFLQLMNCSSTSVLLLDCNHEANNRASHAEHATTSSGRMVLQAEYPYSVDESPYYPGVMLPEAKIFERLSETEGIFCTEDINQEPELEALVEFLSHHQTRSLLIVPIISGSTSNLEDFERNYYGLLLAHKNKPYHFNPEEIELARTVSNQVAIALQNAQLIKETLLLSEDLEIRVQNRTVEVALERQRAEALLRIITELSASLDLGQVLQRTLQVLSEFVDAAEISILIVHTGEKNLQCLAAIGYPQSTGHSENDPAYKFDQSLANWIISNRQSLLIRDVLHDELWLDILSCNETQEPAFRRRSAMGVLLSSGTEALGCLLMFHPMADHFSMDQLDLAQAAGNQVAVAVNNAELYRLIRDQAEDLGSMLRSQQIENSRSQAIFEAVADGVLVTDNRRIITLFNESAEKILGLERKSVLGKSMKHFSGLFGPASQRWMEVVDTWSHNPGSYRSGEMFADRIILEDGRVISVHLSPVSMRNNFLGTVSIFQDITHQVEVDRLKSEFVATVSHELRTPMTSIKGYVDVLLMGVAGQLNDQQTEYLKVVKVNTERLTVLVNDLLDISQIEAGRMRLVIQPVNLDDIADQATADLKHQVEASDKKVIIDKSAQPNLPRVLADPERIRRVLNNLLDNAYQYNLPNGHILVQLNQVGDEVQVDVIDSGMGIQVEDQERVFERFFRGESTLALGVAGTGLGLSIVQNLIRLHNGRIWLESSGIPGEGSTFSFTLPVYAPNR